jgi:hypothetical protein
VDDVDVVDEVEVIFDGSCTICVFEEEGRGEEEIGAPIYFF